jgi:putative transposase
MKKRFNEEQIIRSLKEHVAGKKTTDIVRKYHISKQIFYR